MIYKFDVLKELFAKIDKELKEEVSVFVIGGAVLLYHGIGKEYTKDIDLVFKDNIQFENYRNALHKLGFVTVRKPITHDELNIFEMLEKNEFRFDLFVNTVVEKFCLSDDMVKRSEKVLKLNFLKVHICSKEDIVLFKSLSPDRQNDIEDSVDLIKRGIDWDIINNELKVQHDSCNDKEKGKRLVWYFIERIHDLESKGLTVPIKDKVKDFYDKL